MDVLTYGLMASTMMTLAMVAPDRHIHGDLMDIKKPNDCTRTALGNLIMGSLYQIIHLKSDHFVEKARELLLMTDGDLEKCRKETRRMEIFIIGELKRQKFPVDVHDCPMETLPYNLFLCRMDWPTDLIELLPTTVCRSSCAQIHAWNEYHVRRGVSEFPPGWHFQLDHMHGLVLERDVRRKEGDIEDMDLPSELKQGKAVLIEYAPKIKRQHGVQPIKRRFVKEFQNTNIYSPGNFTRQAKCLDDEWIYAIEDGLPFGITIHCNGTRGFAGTRTIGNMTGIKPKLIDCRNQVDYKPPNGSYLIGMSNRIVYKELDFLVAGVFLCSGEENWSQVKETKFNGTNGKVTTYDSRNGTGEIVRCKPGQMVCTIELKMVMFENKSFTTDVRVGCCEAPEDLIYSSLTLVPIRASLDGVWVDTIHNTTFSIGLTPDKFKNTSIPKYNFERDYYPEPYGAFVNSVKSAEALYVGPFLTLSSLISVVAFGPLIFGFARFNNMKPNYLKNQNPLFKDAIDLAGIEGMLGNVERTHVCEKGFFHHMVYCSREFGFTCTNGTLVGPIITTRTCSEITGYEAECPQYHLICGLRNFFPGNSTAYSLINRYHVTFICCPVFFPIMAQSSAPDSPNGICGPSGVTLEVEEAPRSCVPVSGTSVKCKTVQTFGVTSGVEVTNSSSVDNATETMIGYTKRDRDEHVASASIQVKQTIRAGIPAMAESETEITGMLGYMYTKELTSDMSNTSLNRVEKAYSFDQAAKQAIENSTETTTEYTIEDGQRALFYDVVRRCGTTTIKSEDFIRILTPTIKCNPYLDFDYLFGASTRVFGYNMQNLTFFGYGLEIENDTFVTPLERSVNWELISLGVKEKFTESPKLHVKSMTMTIDFDFKNAPPVLWSRTTNAVAYNYTFNLVYPNNFRFYRLVGRCGRWKVNTNSIWAQGAHFTVFNTSYEPVDWKVNLEPGTNYIPIVNN